MKQFHAVQCPSDAELLPITSAADRTAQLPPEQGGRRQIL